MWPAACFATPTFVSAASRPRRTAAVNKVMNPVLLTLTPDWRLATNLPCPIKHTPTNCRATASRCWHSGCSNAAPEGCAMLPIGDERVEGGPPAAVTYGLILLNVLMFVFELNQPSRGALQSFIQAYGV